MGRRGGEGIACAGACPGSDIRRWERKLLGARPWIAALAKAALFFIMGVWLGWRRSL